MTALIERQRELRETLSLMWQGTPDDVKAILVVAMLMPILMMSYLLGWNLQVARLSFALAIAILTTAVASLISRRAPCNVALIFDYLAWSLFAVGAFVVFLTPVMDLAPIAWRIVAGAAQAVMVGAWVTLWRVRRRWLARTIAGRAALAASLGFILFMISNFLIPDPLAMAEHWGIELPWGVIGRTLAPIVELMPALILYALIFPPWIKYLRKHGAV